MTASDNAGQMSGVAIYRRLLGYALAYWQTFALGILCMVVLAASQPLVPALLKPLLDGSFVDRDLTLVGQTTFALVGAFLVRGIAAYLSALTMAWVAGKVVMDLRAEMFERLMSMPISDADSTSSGRLISKVTFDAQQVTDASTRAVMVLVSDSLTVVALLAWMAYLDWMLTLLTLATAPVVMGTVYYFTRRLRRMSVRLQEKMGEVTDVMREVVDGNHIVRIFDGQDYERERFGSAVNWARRYQLKFASAANATGPIAQFIVSIALAFMIYVTAYQSTNEQLTIGGFVSFLAAMMLLFPPMRRLTAVNAPLQRGIAAASSVFDLVDADNEPDYGTRTLGRTSGQLEFDRVCFNYGNDRVNAVENVTLTIRPGEMVALVGPSGSGKSTIANLIPRFYEITDGVIRLDGEDIRDIRLADLRRQIALVNQDVVLFDDTVARNIAYGGMAHASREAIEAAARSAFVMDFVDELPDGLDTEVGERGVRLSGGQRQRIAVARAFLKDAPILILDEATSALDNESERQVQKALEQLRQGRSTLVIAHRLSTIENADQIVVMANGRVVETGTHRELLDAGELYSGLYRYQLLGDDGAGEST